MAFFKSYDFYNLAHEIDRLEAQGSYGGRSLLTVSHGEGFLHTMLNRFSGNGIYILDEPDAALSFTGQFILFSCIHRLVEETSSQFFIATHSPILMVYPNAEIGEFQDEIRRVSYQQSNNYQLYRSFFENPRILDELLRNEEEDK